MIRKCLLFILLLLINLPVTAQDDLATIFGDYEGTFVLYDLTQDSLFAYNPDRAIERLPPFSTFKVAHTIIALETGNATTADFQIAYNADRYPYEAGLERFYTPSQWQTDHTLRSAVQLSIVWYFREMAGLIGQDDMQYYVDQFDYGNQDISAWLGKTSAFNPAPFWLGGSLEISALEQVLFLKNFYQDELGISSETRETALDILTLYEEEDYHFYGKTGTRAGDLGLAWFIGIIEQGDEVYIFAFNVDADPSVRSDLLRAILVTQGLMPEGSPLFR